MYQAIRGKTCHYQDSDNRSALLEKSSNQGGNINAY